LDAADATTKTFSGSNLTVWNDKSENARHMNSLAPSPSAGAAVYPTAGTSINGLATVNFIPQSGIKQSTTFGGVTNLFWVGRIAAPGVNNGENYYFLLGHDSSYDWCGRPYGDKFVDPTYTQSGIYNASPVSLFTPDINAIANATFSSVYMPTSPNVSILSVAGITGSTNYQGLCYDRINHHGWCGDLAEVIIFSTALSTPNRQTIESYLAQKWGMTASLPVGHPGLTTTVYGTTTVTLPKQKIRSIPKTVFTSFLPTSITGCSLWLDAADLTSLTVSGGAVSQWNDKSGNANNATQSTSGNQPTSGSITQNGLNVLNLTSKTMTYPTISLTTMTVFCVYRQLDFTSYRQPLSVGAFAFFYANGGTVGIGRLAVTDEVLANWSTYGLNTSAYTIYGGTVSIAGSTTTNMYFNGTNVASNTVNSSGGVVRYEIGRSELSNSGYIAEVLIYNSVLSQTNRQSVESYLAQKWGLTSSLAPGHPGLTTTVYGTVAATVKQKIAAIPATVPLISYTQTFAYTGSNQTFAVPATTTSITVYMWGAGGGGGYSGTGALYGGAGAYLQGRLTVTAGANYTVIVGGGGVYLPNYPTSNFAYGGGGTGGNGSSGGGGRSALRLVGASDDVVTVGAGGGAAYWNYNNSYGGNGDSVTGTGGNGGISGSYYGGRGGTQSAGGAVGFSDFGYGLTPGSKYTGGNAVPETGGGGGGGYYGGGGGGYYNYGSGGGGGSSYTSNLTSIVASNSPDIFSAPYTTSPYYQAGIAAGGSNTITGGNGRVVLVYVA
jgi:hypothetical protein